MSLPIEVKPSAKRYYKDEEPQSNRLRGALLTKLGAHAKTATMYVESPIASPPAPELTPLDPYRDKGEDTLFVGDPRTIREIVSSPAIKMDIIDVVPLLASLEDAIVAAEHAFSENNSRRLGDSLTNIKLLVDQVASQAETAGLTPAVSILIKQANNVLLQYALAA